jgi:type IV fimbrial biogenesis protein FimT
MLKPSSPRRAARGMTLIEIAVVLVILGLMLVAAMPSLGAWLRNTQVRNTATSILNGLAQARNEAIRRNTPIRFSFVSLTDSAVMNDSCAVSRTGVSWVVSARDPAGHCSYAPSADPAGDAADADNPLIVQANAGGVGGRNVVVGTRLADGSNAGGVITFNGFGRVTEATPVRAIDVNNETLGNDYRRLRIEIAPGGAARLCDMGVSNTTDPRSCATLASIP